MSLRTKHFRTISSQLFATNILTNKLYNDWFIYFCSHNKTENWCIQLWWTAEDCDRWCKERTKYNLSLLLRNKIKLYLLILTSKTICTPGFYVFDDNGKFNETICDHKAAHFRKNVSMGDKVKLVLINNSSFQSGNSEGIVKIYAGILKKKYY